MPTPWYSVKAAAEQDVAEISILEPIYPYFGCDAYSFLTELKGIAQTKVRVLISSVGGSVMEAFAIFNGLRLSGKEIEVYVLSVAASAASYIAMAGDKIVMPKNTMMFLHNPRNGVYGDAAAMREAAEVLDKWTAIMTATYMKRWKGEPSALTEVLDAESFLTADECLAYGFCDEVVDEIAVTATVDAAMLPPALRERFGTKPAAAAAAARVSVAAVEAMAGDMAAHAAAVVNDPNITTEAQARQRFADIREIVACGRVSGRPEQAALLIREFTPLVEARALMSDAWAQEDGERHTSTARTTESTKPKTPEASVLNAYAIWDEINAAKAGSN
jgi:ATP-dependent Clp protease, protease subunit